MNPRSMRLIPFVAAVGVLWLAGVAAPQATPQKAQMAEDVFKNIQVLKGIPVDDFMGTMGIMSAPTKSTGRRTLRKK